jgi:prophage regulatory protein
MAKLNQKLLRLPQVKEATGLSKSSIYARIAQGTFPKQIQLSPRIVAWLDSDIQKWINNQVNSVRA